MWKGGWSHTLALNALNATLRGIDPYPGSFGPVRERMLGSARALGLESRFQLLGSWEDLASESTPASFDVIHLDGEHTETAVTSDLAWAVTFLAPDGVIVVDDIAHPYFPGIASAAYRFVHEAGFAVFLYSEHKAYLTRRASHGDWIRRSAAKLGETPLIVERHFQEFDVPPPAYSQVPDINGYPMLLCVHPANGGIALSMLPLPSDQSAEVAAGPGAIPDPPHDMAALVEERDNLAARVRDIEASRSWRFTAWLRAIRDRS